MPRKKVIRKKPASRSRVFKTARIGRFDGELHSVSFKDGDKVSDLLNRASITLSTGEEVNDERGNSVTVTEVAKEQDYYCVGNHKNMISK